MNKTALLVQVILCLSVQAQPAIYQSWHPAAGSPGSLVHENIGFKDQTIEELRATPVRKVQVYQPAGDALSEDDVKRIKITADSIPVLIFQPGKTGNLPSLLITTAEDLSPR